MYNCNNCDEPELHKISASIPFDRLLKITKIPHYYTSNKQIPINNKNAGTYPLENDS